MDDLITEEGMSGDEKIVHEAKRRFNYCESVESATRGRWLDDFKIAEADSINKWQWPDKYRMRREANDAPCLTINKIRQHNLNIINDAKQNMPSVRIIPVGGGATFEAAQTFMGIVRHINYISNADDAYDLATEYQVKCGIGYVRVSTDYADDDSFDQEIFIEPVKNPLNVFIDPDIRKKDGSDACFGFIFDDMTREEFNEAYPKYKNDVPKDALGDVPGWSDDKHVKVVEYFRCVHKKDKVISVIDPSTGQPVTHRMSNVPDHLKEMAKKVVDLPETKFRDIMCNEWEHYLIAGEKILERTTWLGQYLPIVRFVGEETFINGEIDRKGHTRALIDQQRMYNYNASASVEYVALQSKSPFLAPAQAIEGLETYWDDLNTENPAVLPYNHVDDDGNPIPAPTRADPPQSSAAYMEGMQIASQQMDMASGQFEATFGQVSNERSGLAIKARSKQTKIATYHYDRNRASAIRYVGVIIQDLIPKIYDTARVIRIMAEDGTDSHVQLDPNAPQAHQEMEQQGQDQADQKALVIFNPNVGKYDVMSDPGPGYATRREETFDALTSVMEQNEHASVFLGDIWAKNADWPDAPEVAERFKNMMPPQALGKGPDPQVAELTQQLQKANAVNAKLINELAQKKLEDKDYSAQKEIDVYDAETRRMKVEGDILKDHLVTPKQQTEMLHELAVNEHSSNLDFVGKAMDADIASDTQEKQQQHEQDMQPNSQQVEQ